jgi:spore maturation protein CgeB
LVEPGRDLVDFGTPDELVEKISYYLEHEKERKAIAANGYRQVKDKFRMEDSLSRILAII